jgi:hydrogenase expression/formation protein HypC
MCVAVPGRILSIDHQPPGGDSDAEDPLWRIAQVDFGGVRQQVSLACLPQARVGDRVLVHVGFALSLVEDELEPSP